MLRLAPIVFHALIVFPALLAAQSWIPQSSGVQVSLRGLGAVNDRVVWASGEGGNYIKTTDGGETWTAAKVPGAESLDFRDLHAADARTVWLLSIGEGAKSRIYRTADAGATWTLQFTNPDTNGFLDALDFWDRNHGIAVGDPVDGHLAVFTTDDGGAHWTRRQTPPALPGEGAFAASGTCVIAQGSKEAWIATGAARVLHSRDRGRTWSVTGTPVRHDLPSAGIFSIAMDGRRGVVVGGDYAKDKETRANIAITADGGAAWVEPPSRPGGFRSAVRYVPALKLWIAVGTSGSDVSANDGRTWKQFGVAGYHAIAFSKSGVGWASGPKGAVAKFSPR